MEADDQSIHIILMGHPEDIYAAVDIQNPGIQNVRNQNGLIVVPRIANQNLNPNGNGNVVAARAEDNAIRNNGDLEEIEEVNASCILMANLQQASTSSTHTNKAPIYNSYGLAKGLRHNLFSVRQFCDSDLEVALRRNTCFVKNLEVVDLLKGNLTTNLYIINLHEIASASPICIMARDTSIELWLWHQRLSYLNFDTINDLAKNDLVTSLPKFKYHKEHLCPSCEKRKSKKASYPPKPVLNSKKRIHLLHMNLCGPMRVKSINDNSSIPINNIDELEKQQSEDPFNIYRLLRKQPGGKEIPVVVNAKVMNNSQDIYKEASCDNVDPNIVKNGGSILGVMEDMIRVGKVMGYSMDGWVKDLEQIIRTQGVGDVSRKRLLWDYVSTLIDRWNGEVVVFGDFNEVRNIDERRRSCFNPTSARVFDQFISASGLVDVKMKGYKFTWSHPSGFKMSKLDRFLVSEGPSDELDGAPTLPDG
uniref:Retrovirus-related Pol polyprotein from transposon TNT 1-94 n=1 Tax=Tanacetum cinerariifolium TaxID=118510 RepID=A0A6L2J2X3_TANCI|nr:retrovirus-related Pol polyprotein from transposon TNT 1-94 [Tanacetum cinerariifolium]